MAKKEFTYRGKTIEELESMTINEVAELFQARARRSLKRGLTDKHKVVLKKIKKNDNNLKTHCRDMVILPEMINKTVKVHNGKGFVSVEIQPEMIGHFLGEFALTRKNITHSAPGIGATKSSANISVK
ncbi:MAG: 30S ribosomal protein S19 [Nanoarchaeota archaeon]|nr:30S ribosomal protein S19 [Nanoarchaeota archaeon]